MARDANGLRSARTGLLVLAFATFSAVTTEMLPMGLLPAIGDSFRVGEPVAGRVVSIYAAAVAVFAVPLTLATRRLPGKYVLLASALVFLASNLMSTFAPSLPVFAIARLIGGITHALFFAIVIGYATRLVPSWLTGRALALTSAGASAGFILGVPLSTALGNATGWRIAFGGLVVLMLLELMLIVLFLPDIRVDPERARTPRGSRPGLVGAVGANALAFLGHYALYTYISVLLLASGVPLVWVGPVLLVFGAFGMAGIWASARQLDRRPRLSALVILGGLGACMVGVGLAFPATLLVLLLGVLWNTASGPIPSLFQAAAVRTRATSPELAGAWINATSNVGIGAGAFFGGAVLDRFGIQHVAWAGAAFLGLAIGAVLLSRTAFPAGQARDPGGS